MKATELMLNDWVLDNRVNVPLRVSPFMAQLEVPEWSPLYLTPEILEKNGFYKDWDNKTYLMGELFRLTPLTDGFGYYLNKWFSMQIYYVHTLQHALRLCGLNELADNFKI